MTEAWQDRDSRVRKESCRGCDYFANRMQVRAWEDNGRRRKAIPENVLHCFCKYHQLHLEYIDRIYQGEKECPHFTN